VEVARQQHRRDEVDRDQLLDRRVVVVDQRGADVAAGVVDQHVERPALADMADDPRAVRRAGHVARHAGHPVAELAHCGVDLGRRARDQRDLGAELQQLGHDRPADPARASGHERVPTAQLPR
jgi:hypothetical protein